MIDPEALCDSLDKLTNSIANYTEATEKLHMAISHLVVTNQDLIGLIIEEQEEPDTEASPFLDDDDDDDIGGVQTLDGE